MCSEPSAFLGSAEALGAWTVAPGEGDEGSSGVLNGAGAGPGSATPKGAPTGACPCPCQDSRNSTKPEGEKLGYRMEDFAAQVFTGHHKRVAYMLEFEVRNFIDRWGIEHVAFLTLTFAEHVVSKREAAKRFNSLRTHVLAKRYPQFIAMWERHKSGRWHVHLLVAIPWADIRTGFDWDAVRFHQDYRSASKDLRAEWAFWGGKEGAAKRHRFGRTELRPLRTTVEAVASYLSKYLSKHIDHRHAEDKKVRVLAFGGYERGLKRRASTDFAWSASTKSRLWRQRVAEFGEDIGATCYEDLSEKAGPRWAWHLMQRLENERRKHETDDQAGGAERVARERVKQAEVHPGAMRVEAAAAPVGRPLGLGGTGVRNPRGDNGRGIARDGRATRHLGLRERGSGGVGGSRVADLLRRLTAQRVLARQLREARESRTPLPKRSERNAPAGAVKVESSPENNLDGAEEALHSRSVGAGGMAANAKRVFSHEAESPDFRFARLNGAHAQSSSEAAPNPRRPRPARQAPRLVKQSWNAYSCPKDNE